jgi:hypothetical protein
MSDKKISYRSAEIRASGPQTVNLDERSLEFVISTETPVPMYDWERGEVIDEVLLAKGAVMPKQVPLLDTHDRYSVKTVLGSVRGKTVEDGLVSGRAYFSSVAEAEEAFTKYREGHLTDFSAGYTVNDLKRVKKGEKVEIDGRTWNGPVNVVTSWTIKEASCCPIGADPKAKARNKNNNTEANEMPEDNERMEKLETSVSGIEKNVTDLADIIKKQMARQEEDRKVEDIDAEVEKIRKDRFASKAKAVQDERLRCAEIDKMCERFDVDPDLHAELITDGVPVDKARERIMDWVAGSLNKGNTSGIRISITKEERDKSRTAAIDGLLVRAGIGEPTDAETEFQHLSLFELAKNRIACANQSIRGMSKEQIFERALSTSDFDNILADVANKAMLEGFEKAEETYTQWADTSGRVNDFRDHVFARASEAPSLVEVNAEGGEYTYGSMSDAKETVAVTDYGIIVPFTRKLMVNDDLGALADIREKLGAAAARKYGDLVYAVLTGNPTMGDGNSLFDATNHSNYVASGSGAAPSVATLNTAAAAMATQTDTNGLQNLNIRPVFILSPWALKGTVDNLLATTTPVVPGSASTPGINPWAYLTPIYDARLDASVATAWFLAARKGMTVKLFTMNGNMTPLLESKAGWAVDGMEFKCRVTAAAKAMDWRGLYENYGA